MPYVDGLHRKASALSLDLTDLAEKDNDVGILEREDDFFPFLSAPSCASTINDDLETGSTVLPEITDRLRKVRGLGYIVIAAFSYSIVAVCVKVTSKHSSSNAAVFWRMTIAWVASCFWLGYKKRGLVVERKYWGIILFRSFIGTISVSLKIYAMCNMVLTDAVAIIFTSPIFTSLLAAAVLQEPVSWVDVVATFTSFVGLIFVTRPKFIFPQDEASGDKADPLAILSALGASIALAIVYVLLRRMRGVDYLVSIHYFLTFGSCYAVLSLRIFNERLYLPLEPKFWFAIVGSGFFAYIGQVFLSMGLNRENAGIASVMRYFDVVFVLLWDVTVLDEHVALFSILGAIIILAGATVIVVHKARSN